MKTPEQIADEALSRSFDPTKSWQDIIIAAIEADRAQRTVTDAAEAYKNGGFDSPLAAALYDALTDRETNAADAAAEWVAENEDDLLWDQYLGPLLDDLEGEAAQA